jgi:hypothetical protein
MRDSLQNCSGHVSPSVTIGESDPARSGIGIGVRGALSSEVWKEKEPFCARWGTRSEFVEFLKVLDVMQDHLVEPVQASCSGKDHAHEMPSIGDRMAKSVQRTVGRNEEFFRSRKDDSAGTQGCAEYSGLDKSHADR